MHCLLICLGLSDYFIPRATINIPAGAMTGEEFCRGISLAAEGDVEQREETFTLTLAIPPTGFSPVILESTVKTVTIIDGDSE